MSAPLVLPDQAVTKSDTFLAQACDVYRRGECGYRDTLLETGQLLHQFVLARLEEGDLLPRDRRQAAGIVRAKFINDAACRLKITPKRVRELIGSAAVVELLGDGIDLDTLGHTTLRYFYPFVQRRSGVRHHQTGTPGNPISQGEQFVLRHGYEEVAKSLFRRAVAEKWTQYQVAAAVKRTFAGKGEPRHERYEPKRTPVLSASRKTIEEFDDEVQRERDSLKGWKKQASAAAPGDVAEMCMNLVRLAQDPRAVALCLQGQLSALLGAKRKVV